MSVADFSWLCGRSSAGAETRGGSWESELDIYTENLTGDTRRPFEFEFVLSFWVWASASFKIKNVTKAEMRKRLLLQWIFSSLTSSLSPYFCFVFFTCHAFIFSSSSIYSFFIFSGTFYSFPFSFSSFIFVCLALLIFHFLRFLLTSFFSFFLQYFS